uniref:Uncharacterized protein n=1 Tax=Theileria annulata TaxID=5874 RepID=A0A3B0NA94_THEAN
MVYIIALFMLVCCNCVKYMEGSFLGLNQSLRPIHKMPFLYYSQKNMLKLNKTQIFAPLKKEYNTPSTVSKLFSDYQRNLPKNQDKRSYKEVFKDAIGVFRVKTKVTPLVSLISVSGYLIPFMVATRNYEPLLLSLSLPKFVDDIVTSMSSLHKFISSVPNLMELIHLCINKVFISKNELVQNHFIKFNYTQGHILSLYGNLLCHIYSDFISSLGQGFLGSVIGYTMLLSTFTPLLYCMFCALMGTYSQLPLVSQAAQVSVGSDKSYPM